MRKTEQSAQMPEMCVKSLFVEKLAPDSLRGSHTFLLGLHLGGGGAIVRSSFGNLSASLLINWRRVLGQRGGVFPNCRVIDCELGDSRDSSMSHGLPEG